MKHSEQKPIKRQSLPVRWVEDTGFELKPVTRTASDARPFLTSHIPVREDSPTTFIRRQ
jgi:hypothetical protein